MRRRGFVYALVAGLVAGVIGGLVVPLWMDWKGQQNKVLDRSLEDD
ncbi:hypothetical protein ABWI00_20400 [Algihabitans albus]